MGTLNITGGTGLTSCLTVRLDETLKFMRVKGKMPELINSSQQFGIYRDTDNQDVSSELLGEYKPGKKKSPVEFSRAWQFKWYNEIDIDTIGKLSKVICPLSQQVEDKAMAIRELIGDRIAILLRGNDKSYEIPRMPYDGMIQIAKDTGGSKFFIQTDEQDFYDYFKERFPDTIAFDEIPRIKKDPDAHVMPGKGKRVEFAVNFLAALKAMSDAEKLIITTGNTGLWTLLFRGNINNVWQYHGEFQKWQKIGNFWSKSNFVNY